MQSGNLDFAFFRVFMAKVWGNQNELTSHVIQQDSRSGRYRQQSMDAITSFYQFVCALNMQTLSSTAATKNAFSKWEYATKQMTETQFSNADLDSTNVSEWGIVTKHLGVDHTQQKFLHCFLCKGSAKMTNVNPQQDQITYDHTISATPVSTVTFDFLPLFFIRVLSVFTSKAMMRSSSCASFRGSRITHRN